MAMMMLLPTCGRILFIMPVSAAERKRLMISIYILLAAASHAQESNSVFNFLEMPVSAHSTALGGRNISLIEDDASLVFSNPALLSSVSDKTLNLIR